MTKTKVAPPEYDGTDETYNGKVDAVVDLREPGNPKTFMRKDGASKDGDFIEGTVGIRTRHGLLLVNVMDLSNSETFDVSYRVGPRDVREVRADGTMVRVDENERDIAGMGFLAGNRVAFEDAPDDGYGSKRASKATGSQVVRTVALVVDLPEDEDEA